MHRVSRVFPGLADTTVRWVAAASLAAALGAFGVTIGASSSQAVGNISLVVVMLLAAALLATGRLSIRVAMLCVLGVTSLSHLWVLGTATTGTALQVTELELHITRGIAFLSGLAYISTDKRSGTTISLVVLAASLTAGALGPLRATGSVLTPAILARSVIVGGIFTLLFRVLAATLQSAEQRAAAAGRTADLAFVDELTGVSNRRRILEEVADSVARTGSDRTRVGDDGDALIMFDLDHFKQVNDSLGHQMGDQVLRQTADLISTVIRQTDELGRWGGEEFIILLRGASITAAVGVAESCRWLLEEGGAKPCVTASFGVTLIHPDDSVAAVLRRADAALYRAKHGGRNTVVADWSTGTVNARKEDVRRLRII